MPIQQTIYRVPECNGLIIRPPNVADAAEIHRLIAQCPPLDLNSCYAYLLLSTHFHATCAVALSEDHIVAFLGAYLIPEHPTTLFVWQVAVHANVRGKGIGQLMLESLFNRKALDNVEYLEATVAPSNKASLALFRRFAWHHGSPLQVTTHFTEQIFSNEGHEEERLVRIGPILATRRI